MNLESVCSNFTAPKPRLASYPLLLSNQFVSRSESFQFRSKIDGLSRVRKGFLLSLDRRTVACSSVSDANSKRKLKVSGTQGARVPASNFDGVEPFGGKAGSVSFYGLTYHAVEERKLVSAPFDEERSSYFWVLGPVAIISSLIVPQLFVGPIIEGFVKNEVLVEIVSSWAFEVLFYAGLSTFLRVTDRVQRPYLHFSPKRWGLITGLRGYLTSSFFSMGFKIVAPLILLCVCWPVIGLPSVVAVTPFLISCVAQRIYEISLDRRGSSCWPVLPIIFEVYRLYQLTKAVHFVEKVMFSMRGQPQSPQLLEKGGALVAMVVTFQILGLVCLWSLMTFLMRLFPSRPVAERY